MAKEWTVGKVATRCGVKVSTLHFYEEKGLIHSWRNNGNQRRYTPDVIRRVSIIKAALNELPLKRTPDKKDWEKLSTTWQAALNDRITNLERLRDKITGCIGCGCLSMTKCPIYNPDDVLAEKGSGPMLLDPTI